MADKTTTSGRPYSGTTTNADPTTEPGQYPPTDHAADIFGGPLPTGTGAPGSGKEAESLDATNELGQTVDGLTGISGSDITSTGAPGTQGAVDNQNGPDAVTYTKPSDGIGPYEQVTCHDSVSGSGDSTGANDSGYATGGPQLPGIKGNEPEAGSSRFQPGGGRVMRGGRAVRG